MAGAKRKLDEMTQHLTEREHILKRAGMYLGDTELREGWHLGLFTPDTLALVPEDCRRAAPGFEAIAKAQGFGPAMVRAPMTDLLVQTTAEIMNNALDRVVGHPDCDRIRCAMNAAKGEISITNNGPGFPLTNVLIDGEEVPTMVGSLFKLRTGSNFGDDEAAGSAKGGGGGSTNSAAAAAVRRITGGMHGFGATLTAVWSKAFVVQSESLGSDGNKVQQKAGCTDNMARLHPPYSCKKARTEKSTVPSKLRTMVAWVPDWERMGYAVNPIADPAIVGILCRIMCELFVGRSAALPAARKLNLIVQGKSYRARTVKHWAWTVFGTKAKVRGNLHLGLPLQGVGTAPRWLTLFATVPPEKSEMIREGDKEPWRQVPSAFGFVNALRCQKGTLRKYVDELARDSVHAQARASSDAARCSLDDARKFAWVGYVATVPSPRFKSQVKEEITSSVDRMTTEAHRTHDRTHVDRIVPASVVRSIEQNLQDRSELAQARAARAAIKSSMDGGGGISSDEPASGAGDADDVSRTRGLNRRRPNPVPKGYTSAGLSGTDQEVNPCQLYVTEGESAAAMFKQAFDKQNFALMGIFAMRGKLLNLAKKHMVIDKKKKRNDLMDFFRVLGLVQFDGKRGGQSDYNGAAAKKLLRYRRVILAMDQDSDGMHIVSLVMTNLQQWNPTIFEAYPDYLARLVTPLLIVRNCRAAGAPARSSDTQWFYTRDSAKTFLDSLPRPGLARSKYIKGLGTIDVGPRDMKRMLMTFVPIVPAEDDEEVLERFMGKKSDGRKELLQEDMVAQHGATDGIDYQALLNAHSEARDAFAKGLAKKTHNGKKGKKVDLHGISAAEASVRMQIAPLPGDQWAIGGITRRQFFHVEFREYMHVAARRNLPGFDGLVKARRQFIYAWLCLLPARLRQGNGARVSEAANAVAQAVHYDHGSGSLEDVGIQLASEFVGIGGVSLIQGRGRFMNRTSSESAAAPRYTYMEQEPLTKYMVRAEDLAVAQRQLADGVLVEPAILPTVLPLALLNGVRCGISVGFTSLLPPIAPMDVLEMTRSFAKLGRLASTGSDPMRWLEEADGKEEALEFIKRFWGMRLHYVGFRGPVELLRQNHKPALRVSGRLRCLGTAGRKNLTLQVEDVPCTQFADTVAQRFTPGETGAVDWVRDCTMQSAKATVSYSLLCDAEETYRAAGLHPEKASWDNLNSPAALAKLRAKLNLEHTVYLNQYNLSRPSGAVVSPPDLLSVFLLWARERLTVYNRRLDFTKVYCARQELRATQRARYIREIRAEDLRPRAFADDIAFERELRKRGYRPDADVKTPPRPADELLEADAVDEDDDDDDKEEGGDNVKSKGTQTFTHLTQLRHVDETEKRAKVLEDLAAKLRTQLEVLEKLTPVHLWLSDIAELRPELVAYQRRRAERESFEAGPLELEETKVAPRTPPLSFDVTSPAARRALGSEEGSAPAPGTVPASGAGSGGEL